jgi:putative spermidine/putrescine transport system ATP-binding protein
LDAQVRTQLRDEIRRLQLGVGITTLFVTHDQEEALTIADRVGVMRSGRLEQCDTPAELNARPATAFVAEFVGTMNRLPAVTRVTATLPDGTTLLADLSSVCGGEPAAQHDGDGRLRHSAGAPHGGGHRVSGE